MQEGGGGSHSVMNGYNLVLCHVSKRWDGGAGGGVKYPEKAKLR